MEEVPPVSLQKTSSMTLHDHIQLVKSQLNVSKIDLCLVLFSLHMSYFLQLFTSSFAFPVSLCLKCGNSTVSQFFKPGF